MNIIVFSVLSVATVICGTFAFIGGLIVKFALFSGSSQENFSVYNDQTKIVGAVMGVLFGVSLVAFLFKPHKTYSSR